LPKVRIERPPKPLFAHHYYYFMSTWVRVIDSEEPDSDEPKEVWVSMGGSRKRKRSRRSKGSMKVIAPMVPVMEPAAPMEYPGDPTEQEVIDNVRGLPDARSGGKVIICFLGVHADILTVNVTVIQSQNDFLREWLPRRAQYLKVILSEEAPRDPGVGCRCGRRTANWRCKHCSGGRVMCRQCCRSAHKFLPFHRVELWNGRYFQAAALWQTGLKLHLGHQGMICPARAPLCGEGQEINGVFYLVFVHCLIDLSQIPRMRTTTGPRIQLLRRTRWKETCGATQRFQLILRENLTMKMMMTS
jgi:hypothetical protein